MIAKKNAKLNLEKNRGAYMQVGLFVVAAGILSAFTYKTPTEYVESIRKKSVLEVPVELEHVVKETPKVVETPKQDIPEPKTQSAPVKPTQTLTTPNQSADTRDNTHKKVTSDVQKDLLKDVDIVEDGGDLGAPPKLDDIIEYPSEDPKFVGGQTEMMNFIMRNVKYPEDALEMGEQGKVYIEFIVEKSGQVSNVKYLNKVYASLDREAKRVVKSFPKWIPGENNGEKCRTRVRIPIFFKIAQ